VKPSAPDKGREGGPGETRASGAGPEWVPRVAPFALFIAFLIAISFAPPPVPPAPGGTDWRWLYAFRTLVVGGALIWFWRSYGELRFPGRMTGADWALAISVGVGVFGLWIVLHGGWMQVSGSVGGFDPRRHGTEDIDWLHAIPRLVGLALVVPFAEELFWRSFLMRWLVQPRFLEVWPQRVGLKALAITSVLFALEHDQWLAGLIAGVAYGGLYMHSRTLWSPVVAHAITNALLGAWVISTRDWSFW